MNASTSRTLVALIGLFLPLFGIAQTPVDLFTDAAPLGAGFVRIGVWNLQHVDTTTPGASIFLSGTSRDADNDIKAATFAKAIRDLGLDILFVVENQPRNNEENRIQQIRDFLNQGLATAIWKSDESNIPYTVQPVASGNFGGLQFAVIWNSSRATIDPAANKLLLHLRQSEDLRAPWQVPVTSGGLSFDAIVLHLKSGGAPIQQDEVNVLEAELRSRLSQSGARPVILCGDWNIRPDEDDQVARLRQLEIPTANGKLMRLLTIESTRLTLDDWLGIGKLTVAKVVSKLVPFSHYNAVGPDSFLDHLAISSTLSEQFDHPLSVTLADGRTDLVPGIQIAVPAVPESTFAHFTDHVPVILTLRTTIDAPLAPATSRLEIIAVMPNPIEPDAQHEQVRVRNVSVNSVALTGWTLRDASGARWNLDTTDGSVAPGETKIITRKGRAMALDNQGGDTVRLFDPAGNLVHEKSYSGTIASGVLVEF
jgi:endonuclease/exonuclease/phosphatase family metal-dependent hydrolase